MELPKLRTDLVISRQERAGKTLYVLKDPISERFFQLGEKEFFIASALNGTRGPDEVVRLFEEKFRATMSTRVLRSFVARLADVGFLEGTEPAPTKSTRFKPRPVAYHKGLSRYFMITVKAFDPDRLLEAITDRLRFAYTWWFVAAALAALSLAAFVAVSNRSTIWGGMSNVFQFRNLLMAWIGVLLVGVIHELAHATTCRHFGGRVREMGVLLFYFQPCLFSNVSDAWLFGKKAHRMWVTFAGGFVEMIMWGVSVLVWRVTAPETWIHHLAFILMAASGLTILFNFNPLIRLDGYYLLSDYLEIPNLRQKAFAYIRSLFERRLLGLRVAEKPLSLREKRIYVSYGLIAIAYTAGLLGFVLYRLSRFLVNTYGWWALALVVVGALYAARNQVKEAVKDASEKVEDHKEEVLSKRRIRLFPIVILLLLVVLFFVPWPLKIKGDFVLLAQDRATVRTEIEGTIAEVHCREGDRVRAGDPIVALADVEIEAALKQTDAEIDEAEARLELLKKGARPEEIQRARSEVKAAEVSLELERSNFERAKELLDKELISLDEFERAKSTVELREQELEGARAELALLLSGSRPEEIREAEATVERLRAERELLDYQKGIAVIRAPISGVVVTPFMDQLADVYVEPGDEICEIADCSVMIAEIAVPEKEVGDVAIGKEVKIKAKSFPSKSFYGTVASIAQKADPGEKQHYVTVRSHIQNPDSILRPGMTGKAKIYSRRSSPLRIVIRRIVRSIRTEFWW